jgi:hypothetical protein
MAQAHHEHSESLAALYLRYRFDWCGSTGATKTVLQSRSRLEHFPVQMTRKALQFYRVVAFSGGKTGDHFSGKCPNIVGPSCDAILASSVSVSSLKQNTRVPQFVSGAIIVMTRYSQMLFVNALRRAGLLFVAQGRSKTGSDQ